MGGTASREAPSCSTLVVSAVGAGVLCAYVYDCAAAMAQWDALCLLTKGIRYCVPLHTVIRCVRQDLIGTVWLLTRPGVGCWVCGWPKGTSHAPTHTTTNTAFPCDTFLTPRTWVPRVIACWASFLWKRPAIAGVCYGDDTLTHAGCAGCDLHTCFIWFDARAAI
jgi:hypothetical protein